MYDLFDNDSDFTNRIAWLKLDEPDWLGQLERWQDDKDTMLYINVIGKNFLVGIVGKSASIIMLPIAWQQSKPRINSMMCYEVPGTINDIAVNALLDWGFTVDAVSESFARRHNLVIKPAYTQPIRSTALLSVQTGWFSMQSYSSTHCQHQNGWTLMNTLNTSSVNNGYLLSATYIIRRE